jgi:HK97 gp10 family phage protein
MANVNVFGTKAIESAFKALPARVQNQLVRKGMTEAGRIVRDAARELAPVDTGELKKSIKARRPKGAKRGEIRREVRADAPYAHIIEKGRKGAKAEPFLAPALEAKQSEVLQAIADSVRDGVREAGK